MKPTHDLRRSSAVPSLLRRSVLFLCLLACLPLLTQCAGVSAPPPIVKTVEPPRPPVQVTPPLPAPPPTIAPPPGDKRDEQPTAAPAPAPQFPLVKITVSARDYLLKGQAEDPGYGLWSYVLLFRAPATDKENERCRAFLRAYRGGLSAARDIVWELQDPAIREKSPGEAKKKVNITYWPLNTSFLPSGADEEFFITSYGYDFARLVRGKAKLGDRVILPGPFIIASRVPLSGNRPPRKDELLIIDLSRLDETYFSDVVDFFQRRVLDDPATWQQKFDWELIQIHFKSAIKIQGTPILHAFGRIFEVRAATAAGAPAAKPKKPQEGP